MKKVIALILLSFCFCYSAMHTDSKGVDVHTPFRWIFADSATRVTATTIKRDTTKLALQKSNYTIWVLKDTLPTWMQVDQNYWDSLVVRKINATTLLTSDSVKIRSGKIVKATFDSTVKADSLNFRAMGGTVKGDTAYFLKGIKAPLFEGAVKGNVNGSISGGTLAGSTLNATALSTLDTVYTPKGIKAAVHIGPLVGNVTGTADSAKGAHHLNGGNAIGDSANFRALGGGSKIDSVDIIKTILVGKLALKDTFFTAVGARKITISGVSNKSLISINDPSFPDVDTIYLDSTNTPIGTIRIVAYDDSDGGGGVQVIKYPYGGGLSTKNLPTLNAMGLMFIRVVYGWVCVGE